ncbi:phosphotransferase [Jiangella anatolica]|uniref:Aminoglycoside phosphotransferase domain-containing protein n=1 Tax=Jiangella anatolica TaxID=2670374 RepID=A0A2W2B799_9ACTN|nr:phosphotransferase [Jiangella anatolica]PZF83341.1 hypothetical protein C1I92_12930 [Jiangella anatolica]
MTAGPDRARAVLDAAAHIAGLAAGGATLIRDGANVMYRLPGQVVARIGRPGREDTALREVRVSAWLRRNGVAAVEALDDVAQPVVIDGRPVTWWRELPPHRPAEPAELATVLRAVHALAPPDGLALPLYEPFAHLDDRIGAAAGLADGDRAWLRGHLAELRRRYARLDLPGPPQVIHGDAWQGNVAVPADGPPVLLDLEAVALGHRDWDLIQIAVDHADFARLDAADYRAFVDAYGGYDVVGAPWFRTLADIQELRWTTFALSKAAVSADASAQARHRIACLRGDVPRPWTWAAI